MTEPIIIENDDESIVIIGDDGSPTAVTSLRASSVRIATPGLGYVLPIEDGRVVVAAPAPSSTVLSSIGGGAKAYYREINYDGGLPDSIYGGEEILNGGEVVNGYRYEL